MVMMPSTAAARIAAVLPLAIVNARRADQKSNASTAIAAISVAMAATAKL